MHTNFRTWAALILLAALAVLFASLGSWQLDRAAQRDATHNEIAVAANLPPITLSADTPTDDLTAWRRAQARGSWMHRYTILLENRNYQTRPGYWVATPLLLTTFNHGQHDPLKAVLVLRGWIARDEATHSTVRGPAQIDPGLVAHLAQSNRRHTVTGELFAHVPRLFELWSWSGSDQSRLPSKLTDMGNNLPTLQNLDLNDYAQSTGLSLLPIVLAQTSPELKMIQDWPRPSTDADTNRGYALQWFSFFAIAAGAWFWIAWRALRSWKNYS